MIANKTADARIGIGQSAGAHLGLPGFPFVPTYIRPSGIASLEAFGVPSFGGTVSLAGIASAEAFGAMAFGSAFAPLGIASAEAFGALSFGSNFAPVGIASTEAFGTQSFGGSFAPSGIVTAETFGAPSFGSAFAPSGIITAEAFGALAFSSAFSPAGIVSAEAFGAHSVNSAFAPSGIVSAEAFGAPSFASVFRWASYFPGAYHVLQSDLGVTQSTAARLSNTGATVGTFSGSFTGARVPILLKCTTGGTVGSTARFSASYDGGATTAMTNINPTAGVPFALTGAGAGMFHAWSANVAGLNDTYTLAASNYADQTANGKDFTQNTSTVQPTIGAGLNGKPSIICSAASLVSTLTLPAPGTTPYYTFAVFRQLSWGANLTMWGRTSGLGETVFQSGSTPTLASYSGTVITNGGAAINAWVIAEIKRSNNAADTHKFGSTTTTASSGNNTTTGMEVGSATGANYGNIELLVLVHTPNAPTWATIRAAVDAAYGSGNVLY